MGREEVIGMDMFEAFRALKEGKTISRCDSTVQYRFADGMVQLKEKGGDWVEAQLLLADLLDSDGVRWEVSKEYTLTFGQAMVEAMNGRFVENEANYGCYRMKDGVLTYVSITGVGVSGVSKEEVKAKWRAMGSDSIKPVLRVECD